MATGTDEPTLTVDELAARAGVTVRTVRFYSTRVCCRPRSSGRAGWGTTEPIISPGSR
ncbi:hypothetical protein SMICM304S_11321 [Streptomyces microflavus]